MDRATSDIIIAISVVGTVSLTVLTAYWMSLRAKREARQHEQGDTRALETELDALRSDFGEQIAELQERLDFAERELLQHTPPGIVRPARDD